MAEVVEEALDGVARAVLQIGGELLDGRHRLRVAEQRQLWRAEVGGGHQRFGLLVGGEEHLLQTHHGVLAGEPGRLLHALDLGTRGGGRLLHPDVAPGAQHVDRHLRVEGAPALVVAGADEDGVEFLLRQHAVVVGVGRAGAELVR